MAIFPARGLGLRAPEEAKGYRNLLCSIFAQFYLCVLSGECFLVVGNGSINAGRRRQDPRFLLSGADHPSPRVLRQSDEDHDVDDGKAINENRSQNVVHCFCLSRSF